MNKQIKNIINKGIFICIIVIIITSIVFGIKKLIDYDTSVPDSFMVIEEEPNTTKHQKEDFPKKISFRYSMQEDIPIVGKDKMYTFGQITDSGYDYEFYMLEKNGKEYKLLTGHKKGYPFEDPSFFQLTQPFSFDKQTGIVTVEFLNHKQYKRFVEYVDYGENWRDIFEYIRETEEKESPEK